MGDVERRVTPILADEIRMYAHAYGSWLPLDLARHLDAKVVSPLLAEVAADARREALSRLLTEIKTHNDGPITATALRWAATHEALCRSWIFDVLTGLADAVDREAASHTPEGAPDA